MLTNFLPNGGNGTFTLYAAAKDKEGNEVTLGSKTIQCDNANGVKPFGAIDSPAQGGTASGSGFINWGWVLIPNPNSIPTDGSTINVYVDGVNLGHPVYNIYRSDIAGLLPGYSNSNGAAGYFSLDTISYEDGVHTIQWTAADDTGNTDGIGSRYFTIQNSGNSRRAIGGKVEVPSVQPGISRSSPGYPGSIRITKGYDNSVFRDIYPDDNGINHIVIKELERTAICLSGGTRGLEWVGFQVIGGKLRALPVGSTLDHIRGIFYWQPGPGFIGSYDFIFIDKGKNTSCRIKIKIVHHYTNE
ncbi:MAG: hypothetical protein GY940_34080, partial [bacterium]|nr:hypothetical protein [bacterium]